MNLMPSCENVQEKGTNIEWHFYLMAGVFDQNQDLSFQISILLR